MTAGICLQLGRREMPAWHPCRLCPSAWNGADAGVGTWGQGRGDPWLGSDPRAHGSPCDKAHTSQCQPCSGGTRCCCSPPSPHPGSQCTSALEAALQSISSHQERKGGAPTTHPSRAQVLPGAWNHLEKLCRCQTPSGLAFSLLSTEISQPKHPLPLGSLAKILIPRKALVVRRRNAQGG